jgi:putative hydrolase of the HAD superfamily
MTSIRVSAVGLDADDTLWHNEDHFHKVEHEFAGLVAAHAPGLDAATALAALAQTERSNVSIYGYGVKSFTISMIETAIELTGGRVPSSELTALIQHGKDMLRRPTELLPHVPGVVESLAASYRLVLITKGDPLHQEAKMADSGLAHHFEQVEVVSEKDPQTYRRLIERHGIDPEGFVMVGNSLKSDVLPVLEIGGVGVHVPYQFTWALERAEMAEHHHESGRFHVLEHLGQLPSLLERLAA